MGRGVQGVNGTRATSTLRIDKTEGACKQVLQVLQVLQARAHAWAFFLPKLVQGFLDYV